MFEELLHSNAHLLYRYAENGGIQMCIRDRSAAAWTMYQKYANGLPLYRQEKDWKQYGVQISRTTLANWIIYCSKNYFQPMYDYFHRELLKRSFAMADETRVQVLKEEGRRAQTQSCLLYTSDMRMVSDGSEVPFL